MGSSFSFKIIHSDYFEAKLFMQKAVKEVQRLETMLSEFRSDSITSLLNENAGIKPIKVPEEFYQLVKRCIYFSELSNGAFDISIASLKKHYQFDQKTKSFPDQQVIEKTLHTVNFKSIKMLTDNEIFLEQKGMKLSFAAIGKGYAADKVKSLLQSFGVKSGVVNASGDLCSWGTNAKDQDWTVGIPDPKKKSGFALKIPLNNKSIATSGDRYQYFISDEKKYSHTLNPKTGLPTSGIQSVSVVDQSSERCDALATAIYVLGSKKGLDLINQMPMTHAIIMENNELFFSDKINLNA